MRLAAAGVQARDRLQWESGLRRSFACAGRTCWITLQPLRADDGAPLFEVAWQPAAPTRMAPTDVRAFEAGKREAQRLIVEHLENLE